jgi:hypothetical protein
MGSAALDELRARIRELEGAPAVQRRRAPSGVPAWDAIAQGLPVPGVVEISGPEGAGRSRLALALAAPQTRLGRRVAWVDPMSRLYPPSAEDHGVDLGRLMIVRPPEDGSAPWAWATEQLLRSGCFALVVVDFPPHPGSRRTLAHAWARAAERGGSTAIVLAARPVRELPAEIRVSASGGELVVVRDRGGPTAQARSELPPWPARADPWR